MRALLLRLRYGLTVFTVGVLLTAAVALTAVLAERNEGRRLREAISRAEQQQAALPSTVTPTLQQELDDILRQSYYRRVPLIVGIGLVLAALAALITTLLVTRVDGAMTALMVNADRIGRGAHPGPVQPSGVPEIAALERSLEHMRQALAGTDRKSVV